MMLSGDRAGERVVVPRLPFRMGRGPENDLNLDDFDHVSTAHGELRKAPDGSFQYVDLGSTNGSAVRRAGALGFVDLRGYRRRADHLQAGDELHLGDPTAPLRIAIVFEQDIAEPPPEDETVPMTSGPVTSGPTPVDTISSVFDVAEPLNATIRQPPLKGLVANDEDLARGRVPPLLTQDDRLVPLDAAIQAVTYAQTREALMRGEGDRRAASEHLGIDMDRMLDLLEQLGLA
jgi:hypothetical protein